MISSRFTSKVLIVTVVPVITTALILASILISVRIDEFNKRIDEKGNNIAGYLSPISEYGIFSNNFSYIESTLTHTLKQPDIVAVYIEDHNKSIVLKKTNSNWESIDINELSNVSYKTFSSKILKTSVEIDDISNLSFPSNNTEKHIGTVNVIMNLDNANTNKLHIIKHGAFITFTSTLITILIALLFSRSVTRPIRSINTGVSVIKEGNFEHRIPIKFSGELAELANGINNMTSALKTAKDNEKQRADDELFIEKTKAQITLEAIGEGVITTDIDGNITYLNPAAESLTGFTINQALNQPLSRVFNIRNEDDNTIVSYPIIDCITNSKKISHESGYILKSTDGSEYAIRETATPQFDKDHNVIGAVLVFHDFTSIKKMSDHLSYQATHDDLTGLTNRRAFENRMHDIINNISPDDTHALCYIDLDRFKIINDTCGHLAGDNLLRTISSSINKHIRKNDLFARLGGDEFGVIFLNCDIEKARILAENIKMIISDIKFTWGTHTFNVGSSIGIVPITLGQSMSEIMMTVDTACYVAKDKGRNRIHIYKDNDEAILQRKGELQWFQAINKALEDNSFILYSQRITSHSNKKDDDIHEILIRLDIDGDIIAPGAFIPAAERYSLMTEIDKWVIRALLRTIKTDEVLENNTYFSINLSGQTLTDDSFISFLNSELDNTNTPPDKLIFEITETAAISNFNDAIDFIKIFKKRGCKFALDDFGSGMSSFQYLSELPLDYIKIDGSFVKNIINNPYNQSVIKSISQIGHSLNLKIIAEFVENEDIFAEMDKSLIDYVQGYKIEHPKPLVLQQPKKHSISFSPDTMM